MKKYVILLSSLLQIVACNKPKLTQAKFKKIFIDINVLYCTTEHLKRRQAINVDSMIKKGTQTIFEQNKCDSNDFNKAIKYYSNHSEEFKELIEEMKKEIKTEKEKL